MMRDGDIPKEIWSQALTLAARLRKLEEAGLSGKAEAEIARALFQRDRRAAGIAQVQSMRTGESTRRTKRLGLRRAPYDFEYGNDIAAAILSYEKEAA